MYLDDLQQESIKLTLFTYSVERTGK